MRPSKRKSNCQATPVNFHIRCNYIYLFTIGIFFIKTVIIRLPISIIISIIGTVIKGFPFATEIPLYAQFSMINGCTKYTPNVHDDKYFHPRHFIFSNDKKKHNTQTAWIQVGIEK